MNYEALWLKKSFDVDRLHAVIDGQRYGRGVGRTFAVLTQLMGEVYLGDFGNHYLYLGDGPQSYISGEVMRAFYNILHEEGYTVDVIRRAEGSVHVKDTDQLFLFKSMSSGMECRLRGYRFSRVFVDLMPDTRYHFQEELHMIRYKTEQFDEGRYHEF